MLSAKKYKGNPIIVPSLEKKESSIYNPTTVVRKEKVFLLGRSEFGYENKTISKINLFSSQNGFSFKPFPKNPVIKPEKKYEKMGCEDPRVIKTDKNNYFLTYTAYKGKDKNGDYKIKLMGALSKDLISWQKFPLVDNEKSGAVVQNYKHKDQYVMYFGGKEIKIAFSRDLKKWKFNAKPIFTARKGNFFDNYLVEPGPPPILIKKGILLIYNGKNAAGKFSAGWAIFDKNNPAKLLERSRKPILEPTEYWEKYGKVNNVIFATGLVFFKGKWLLYYGGADKSTGVAVLNF
ncbi:MAG TPA: glycosidase [Candidatus Paceibacterota bacterium]|nr:glycosidase [Candidatus Paceibacterota bacterium]